eukprot:gene13417-4283_t
MAEAKKDEKQLLKAVLQFLKKTNLKDQKFIFGGFELEVFRKMSGESDIFWCVILWFTITKTQRSYGTMQQPMIGYKVSNADVSPSYEEDVSPSYEEDVSEATEDALKSEAGIDEEEYSSVRSLSAVENVPDINSLLAEYENEGDPLNYAEYYKGLQDFIGRTLDIHRPEMSLVLYPLFVHLYLELVYKELEVEANAFFAKFEPYQEGYRQEDLRKLKCITKRDHMFCSNEILDLFRSSKYVIRISRETFGMLKKYLQASSTILPTLTFNNSTVLKDINLKFGSQVAFHPNKSFLAIFTTKKYYF